MNTHDTTPTSSTQTTNLTPTVTFTDGQLRTDSLNVAQCFGKLHKHVLRNIRELEIPNDFRRSNFGPGTYNDSNGDQQPLISLTRDGWTLLVMGFTGKRAMEWKLKYIEAFNQMEAELKAPPPPPQSEPPQLNFETNQYGYDTTVTIAEVLQRSPSQLMSIVQRY